LSKPVTQSFIALSKITLFIFPDFATSPLSSYFLFDFFFIHLSIKQLPGPISEADNNFSILS